MRNERRSGSGGNKTERPAAERGRGGLNEKIRREKVRTAKDGSKEPFFF